MNPCGQFVFAQDGPGRRYGSKDSIGALKAGYDRIGIGYLCGNLPIQELLEFGPILRASAR